jgi:hypothetical protein
MAKGLRYQHRSNCKLITPYGDVELDEDGNVTNMSKFDPEDLLTIDGFVDAGIFGETPPRPKKAVAEKAPEPNSGPTDEQYWQLIKDMVEKGAHLNTEGYIQMEVLTAAIREKEWPPISGTRRIRITDEGRNREKEAREGKVDAPAKS